MPDPAQLLTQLIGMLFINSLVALGVCFYGYRRGSFGAQEAVGVAAFVATVGTAVGMLIYVWLKLMAASEGAGIP